MLSPRQVVETEHPGHATEIAAEASPQARGTSYSHSQLTEPSFVMQEFSGIICVGGDGVLVEALNGIMHRRARHGLAVEE